jgi:hypothetical protein
LSEFLAATLTAYAEIAPAMTVAILSPIVAITIGLSGFFKKSEINYPRIESTCFKFWLGLFNIPSPLNVVSFKLNNYTIFIK